MPLGPGAVARRTAATSRYAARFRCIGAACEDNCCAHTWQVLLDREDYGRLKAALSRSSDGRAAFERGCVRTPGVSARDPRYASLQRAPDGRCAFLAPDGLCSIHGAHGPASLPGVCATYPRVLTEAGDHLSVTGTLSCPEAARLCLLAEDGAQVDEADPASLASYRVRHRLKASSEDPFVRHFAAIRAAFFDLTAMREYPAATRRYASAQLARRLDAARAMRGRSAQDAAVHEAIAAGTTTEVLAALDRDCRAATAPGTLAVALVRQILVEVVRPQGATRFGTLARAVCWPRPEGTAGGAPHAAALRPRAESETWRRAHVLRRRRWEGEFPGRLDQYATSYAADWWMRDPFTESADLAGFVLDLLARVAVIRFLLLGHPSLEEAAAAGSSAPRRLEALDRAAVEVVYTFSRAVEHSAELRKRLHEVIARQRLRGRRLLLELARF